MPDELAPLPQIRQWYNKCPPHMPGTLFVVATPIGNLEDITVRALRVLRSVAVIAAEDTRRTAQLLARHAIATPTTSLHEHNESRKAPAIVGRLARGEDVALVSDAGTPTVSDPGSRLIRAAIDGGIRVEPIPGASAVLAALAVAGFDTSAFAFFGFPPIRSADRKRWFDRVAAVRGTVVFFESPHRIAATLGELRRAIGNCEVVVARELTKVHEQLVRGPISDVAIRLSEAKGELTVVLDIGYSTDLTRVQDVEPEMLVLEFGELTKSAHLTRRAAVTQLARRHQLAPNEVYRILETAKKSGE